MTTATPPQTAPAPASATDVPPGFWQQESSHNPRPLTPLGASIFVDGLNQAFPKMFAEFGLLIEALEYRMIGGYVYNSVVPLGGNRGAAKMPPKPVLWLAMRLAPAFRKRLKRCDAAMKQRLDRQFIDRWYGEWRARLNDEIATQRAVDLAAMSDAELAAHMRALKPWVFECFDIHFYLTGPYGLHLWRLADFCRRHLGYDDLRTMRLLAGLSAASSEPAVALGRLAAQIRADDALARDVLAAQPRDVASVIEARGGDIAAAYGDYLHRYAFRALRYEVCEQSMHEQPELIGALIQDDLRKPFDLDAEQARLDKERAAAEDEALAALPPSLHAEFREALADAQRSYPTREDNEFFTVSVPLAIYRLAALEAARRLVKSDVLALEDDIFFLAADEIVEALAGPHPGDRIAEEVERRREAFFAAEATTPPVSYGVEPPRPPLEVLPPAARDVMQAMLYMSEKIFEAESEGERHAPEVAGEVRGRAAARGAYTGTVRVVMGEHEFDKLRQGDVLVCPITSPVWSVLFAKVGALVTDSGGILSHPAIIAREYGIPAVVATRTATKRLRDGQRVTVDGEAGVVTILD